MDGCKHGLGVWVTAADPEDHKPTTTTKMARTRTLGQQSFDDGDASSKLGAQLRCAAAMTPSRIVTQG